MNTFFVSLFIKTMNFLLSPFNVNVYTETVIDPTDSDHVNHMRSMVICCLQENLDFQQSYEAIEECLENEKIALLGWQSLFRTIWKEEKNKRKKVDDFDETT